MRGILAPIGKNPLTVWGCELWAVEEAQIQVLRRDGD